MGVGLGFCCCDEDEDTPDNCPSQPSSPLHELFDNDSPDTRLVINPPAPPYWEIRDGKLYPGGEVTLRTAINYGTDKAAIWSIGCEIDSSYKPHEGITSRRHTIGFVFYPSFTSTSNRHYVSFLWRKPSGASAYELVYELWQERVGLIDRYENSGIFSPTLTFRTTTDKRPLIPKATTTITINGADWQTFTFDIAERVLCNQVFMRCSDCVTMLDGAPCGPSPVPPDSTRYAIDTFTIDYEDL